MKIYVISFVLCSLSQAAYVSRMTANRVRAPNVFRPGVTVQRPRTHQRLVPAASNRVPYVVYRNPSHRYAVKHFTSNGPRYIFAGPWKSTARLAPLPATATPEYDFIRAASAPPLLRAEGGTGAIHTIPAPNLSLSEKPIVVIDTSENSNGPTTEVPKPTYEVTEKLAELPISVKIEQPIGFSKATSLTTSELQSLVKNGAALQLASEFDLSAIALPQSPILPQQFTIQGYNGYPSPHDLMQSGAGGLVIPPNPLYQTDPSILQKIQNQLLQRYPAVEFIPYNPDSSLQPQSQSQSQPLHPLLLLENEHITKQTPSSFIPSNYGVRKNLVQRETQESAVVTLVPQAIVVGNVTENQVDGTSASDIDNATLELVAAESQPQTTTIKYVLEDNTEEQKTTPVYYAQIDQSVGNAVVSGFYSAINDVRAAAALAQVETPQELANAEIINVQNTTTTLAPEIKTFVVKNTDKDKNNHTVSEIQSIIGVPFAKSAESVKVGYTLMRADDKEVPKVTQDGVVYAGQIVEASVSADQDFDKERANILSRRAPVRLIAVTDKQINIGTTTAPPKLTVVKAKIPPKSKLTFDDMTGEPVLRIYASYLDNPIQKGIITSKLANMKHTKETVTRNGDTFYENREAATTKSLDKTQGPLANQVTQFGVKLKARSDDYIALFEDYEE